ncbi:CRE-PTR-16 protein [Oopsacas minuta]|uniref:CRE-PTR-16 protein n=1 Tax=Oopsacas minuta TaxID=111878 RepID=A0AAV7JBK1_9METZ|nr:CRE-PTR-16 protein [Oopsacas minuta]
MEGQKSKRPAILELYTQGKTVKEITKALSVTKWTVYRTIQHFNETGETSDRPRSGRPRSIRTPLLKKPVREKVRYNPKRSVQKMANECNCSTRMMGRLVHDDLGLKSYQFRKAQLLSDVNKKRRIEKCKKLRERFRDGRHLDILFTDERLSTVECSFNRQNDRVLCSTSKGISPVARIVK